MAVLKAARAFREVRFTARIIKEIKMTRLEMISQPSRLCLCGAAALASAVLLACGGPKPIEGGGSLTGSGGSGSSSGYIPTPGATSTRTSTTTNPGTTTPSDVDGGNCGITTSGLTPLPADLLLVLDRSVSMGYDIASDTGCTGANPPANCTTRWSTMTTSLNQVLASSPADVQWGLKFFTSPGGSKCTVNAGADVAIPGTSAQIQTAIAGTSPGNQTPTTAAIQAAVAYLNTLNDSRSHFILLATDGEPNCDPGTSGTVSPTTVANTAAAIKVAYDAGITTYVIGIGPTPGNLTSFAQNGGTTDYYPATSPDQLTAALNGIVGKVASCVFSLGKVPPDPNNIVIEFNGDHSLRPPRDTTHTNGWDYTSPADTTVQVYGPWCDNITNGTYTTTEVLMGCPGGVIP
jgi:hypothetical protein